MRQKTINICKFDELSDAAKETAREWFRSCQDSSDFDFVIEDAVRMGELMGIEFDTHPVKLCGGGTRQDACIYWSGFCSQGDGASFAGTYWYKAGALKALQAEAPASYKDKDGVVHEQKGNAELHRIARELQQAQRPHFYKLVVAVTQGRHSNYVHENTMSFDYERSDDAYIDSYPSGFEQIEEALRAFARWIYASLDAENDYQSSDECVDESIRANEYEFYENGERA